MNTSKTLRKKFANNGNHTKLPIWYYKKISEVSVDYVIFNLLKEDFVVEINGEKHEITFGINDNGEIGQTIRYDEHNSWLCSFEVISKGFKEGIWYIIEDEDIDADEQKKLFLKNEEKDLDNYRNFHKQIINSLDNEHLTRFKDSYSENDSKYLSMSDETFKDYLINMLDSMTLDDYRLIKNHLEAKQNNATD